MRERISQEEAKRFLRGPREAAQELAARLEQLRRWREAAQGGGLAYGRERVQEQGRNRLEVFACELADLEQEAEAARQRARALRLEQEAVLARLKDARLRQLLRLYYQCGFTWGETADHMSYSERQVLRLHREALAQVAEILQEVGKCHLAS